MTLYQGRISGDQHQLMDAINRSLPVDIRLLPYDVATNRAWAAELCRLGVLTEDELDAILDALNGVLELATEGGLDQLPDDEDVHTLVERLLTERLGDTGARIHTGRSRNDQVACDLHLFLLDELELLQRDLVSLVRTLAGLARTHAETLLAGTTHLQPAQPISLGHFLLSLAFALLRDHERIGDARRRASRCPLGAGALAGSGFAVDRDALARALGFDEPAPNSIDAVSDRDAAQEAAYSCAIMLVHLSRYAEQLIIWSNPALGYVRLSDEWSTGSSMMPQKRNPDSLELVRAKGARGIGSATTLLALTKGVPLSYAKDLQEDKEALFDAIDTARLTAQVLDRALGSATYDVARMRAALGGDLLATDLADQLTGTGVPFRAAHERVAQLVTRLESASRNLLDATDDELAVALPELVEQGFGLDFETAIRRRNVLGGTAPGRVREQLRKVDQWLTRQS